MVLYLQVVINSSPLQKEKNSNNNDISSSSSSDGRVHKRKSFKRIEVSFPNVDFPRWPTYVGNRGKNSIAQPDRSIPLKSVVRTTCNVATEENQECPILMTCIDSLGLVRVVRLA